jgi:hypothetical protein
MHFSLTQASFPPISSQFAWNFIRPDGYIGLIGGSLGPQPIIDYLHDVTGR